MLICRRTWAVPSSILIGCCDFFKGSTHCVVSCDLEIILGGNSWQMMRVPIVKMFGGL